MSFLRKLFTDKNAFLLIHHKTYTFHNFTAAPTSIKVIKVIESHAPAPSYAAPAPVYAAPAPSYGPPPPPPPAPVEEAIVKVIRVVRVQKKTFEVAIKNVLMFCFIL